MDINDAELIEKILAFHPTGERPNLYGKNVAKRMVKEIEKWFGTKQPENT